MGLSVSRWLIGSIAAGALLAVACGSHGDFGGGPDGSADGGDLTDAQFNTDASGGDGGDAGTNPKGCDQSCVAAGGKCVNDTCILGDNPGKVDQATQTKLKAGGSTDSKFKFLYPYNQTVFPRGLQAPTLQFDGTSWDAAYVHVTFTGFDYEGFYGAATPGRLAFSAAVWKALTLATVAKSDVKVEVSKILGGNVTGPVTEHWTIAQGSLRGTIYYETYDSLLAGGLGSVGIMKISPGASQPVVIKSGCGNVCHTASADGSTLVANSGFFIGSSTYDLKNNAATIYATGAQSFTYGGVYPDGSFVVSATNYRTWLNGPSRLYDTKTGANIPAASWDSKITNSGTPAFSPDGKHIAFNHEDTGGGHTLAVADFDVKTKTFSNFVDIATDNQNTLAWPAFTPDGKWVVYHAGSNTAFETDNNETGDVFIVDLATKTVHRLDALDGYTGNQTYLPANDPKLSFAPTVLPEAVGGYFWAVFTSHRSYGNTLPSMDHSDEYGKLWVSAIDLDPKPGADPSHPAFFLDGQEQSADNLRGFWVLNPCKGDGSDCKSGDECCDGYCRPADGGLQCVPPPGGCSHEYEKCTTASDCCDSSAQCINGRCASPPPN